MSSVNPRLLRELPLVEGSQAADMKMVLVMRLVAELRLSHHGNAHYSVTVSPNLAGLCEG